MDHSSCGRLGSYVWVWVPLLARHDLTNRLVEVSTLAGQGGVSSSYSRTCVENLLELAICHVKRQGDRQGSELQLETVFPAAPCGSEVSRRRFIKFTVEASVRDIKKFLRITREGAEWLGYLICCTRQVILSLLHTPTGDCFFNSLGPYEESRHPPIVRRKEDMQEQVHRVDGDCVGGRVPLELDGEGSGHGVQQVLEDHAP